MTSHTPLTGPEIQEMKQRLERFHRYVDMIIEGKKSPDPTVSLRTLLQAASAAIVVDMPRTLSEIDRLRSALQRIEARLSLDESRAVCRDGGPVLASLLIAREALGITPPLLP
jgi:hypothetical protein